MSDNVDNRTLAMLEASLQLESRSASGRRISTRSGSALELLNDIRRALCSREARKRIAELKRGNKFGRIAGTSDLFHPDGRFPVFSRAPHRHARNMRLAVRGAGASLFWRTRCSRWLLELLAYFFPVDSAVFEVSTAPLNLMAESRAARSFPRFGPGIRSGNRFFD